MGKKDLRTEQEVKAAFDFMRYIVGDTEFAPYNEIMAHKKWRRIRWYDIGSAMAAVVREGIEKGLPLEITEGEYHGRVTCATLNARVTRVPLHMTNGYIKKMPSSFERVVQ